MWIYAEILQRKNPTRRALLAIKACSYFKRRMLLCQKRCFSRPFSVNWNLTKRKRKRDCGDFMIYGRSFAPPTFIRMMPMASRENSTDACARPDSRKSCIRDATGGAGGWWAESSSPHPRHQTSLQRQNASSTGRCRPSDRNWGRSFPRIHVRNSITCATGEPSA